MNILERISQLVKANINHLLDEAEDPEVMVKQLIRDMEESIIELRRETVRAVAREKQLGKQIEVTRELEEELEPKASLALDKGDEDLARKMLARKIQTTKTRETLIVELDSAAKVAEQLKADLTRLEDQVQTARRKKEELIRRKRSAEAQKRTQEAARKSSEALSAAADSITGFTSAEAALGSYDQAVSQIESEAEAMRELLSSNIQSELDLQKSVEDNAVEEELKLLKAKRSD